MKKKKNSRDRRTAKNRGKQRVVALQRRAGALAGKPRAPKKTKGLAAGARQKNLPSPNKEVKKAAPCSSPSAPRVGKKPEPQAQQTANKPVKQKIGKRGPMKSWRFFYSHFEFDTMFKRNIHRYTFQYSFPVFKIGTLVVWPAVDLSAKRHTLPNNTSHLFNEICATNFDQFRLNLFNLDRFG